MVERRKKYRLILIMPPKKKGKKKSNNKTKKRQQKGSEGEKTSEKSFSLSAPLQLPPEAPSINAAIFASLQTLPITILKTLLTSV